MATGVLVVSLVPAEEWIVSDRKRTLRCLHCSEGRGGWSGRWCGQGIHEDIDIRACGPALPYNSTSTKGREQLEGQAFCRQTIAGARYPKGKWWVAPYPSVATSISFPQYAIQSIFVRLYCLEPGRGPVPACHWGPLGNSPWPQRPHIPCPLHSKLHQSTPTKKDRKDWPSKTTPNEPSPIFLPTL